MTLCQKFESNVTGVESSRKKDLTIYGNAAVYLLNIICYWRSLP